MAYLTRIGFTQGVKTSFDPSSVPADAIWEARNVRADDSGVLRVRGGVVQSVPSLGNGMIQGVASAFGSQILAFNKGLYKVKDGVSTFLRGNFLGANANTKIKMQNWSRGGREIVYMFSGQGIFETYGENAVAVVPYSPAAGERTNLLRAENGTQDLVSGPAKCTILTLRASLSMRLAAAGNPASPNTVYFSAPLDGSYFPSDQMIQLPDDGGKITALWNWYNALVIFRDKDIWAFFGSDVTDLSAALVIQDTSVGCIAERSIANVPGVGLVFLGEDNVYSLQGVAGVENQAKANPIGDDIRKYLLRAKSDGVANVCATYYNREYRLTFPEAVEPERVFRLSLQHNPAWYIDSGPLVVQYNENEEKLYGASLTQGTLFLFDDTSKTDNGTAIPVYLSFRRESLGNGPSRIKKAYIYVTSKRTLQHINASFVTDGGQIETRELSLVTPGNADFVVGEMGVGQGQMGRMEPVMIFETNFRPSLKGHFVQVRLSTTEPNEDVAILGYGFEFSPGSRIRGIREGVNID